MRQNVLLKIRFVNEMVMALPIIIDSGGKVGKTRCHGSVLSEHNVVCIYVYFCDWL